MSRKEEILAGLAEARQRILETAKALPPGKRDEVFLGKWSIKDLIAHLIGWDYTNIEAVKDIRLGRSPGVFQHWNPDWSAYNARLVKQYKRENFTELLESVRRSHQALLDFVSTIPAQEIEQDFGIRSPRGANITVEWFLQFEVDDEGQHYQQIKDWMQA